MTKEEIIRDLNLLRHITRQRVNLNDFNRGLCPFHQEKIPSFHIYQGHDRARYHCFGCGADGDIFEYLHRTEHLEFSLALKKLQLILSNNKFPHVVFPLPPEAQPGPDTPINKSQIINPPINCFLSCQNYLNLKEDYEILLTENEELRIKLNLNDFQSSNEIKKIAPEPIKPQGEKEIICRNRFCTLTPNCKYDCWEFTLDF